MVWFDYLSQAEARARPPTATRGNAFGPGGAVDPQSKPPAQTFEDRILVSRVSFEVTTSFNKTARSPRHHCTYQR